MPVQPWESQYAFSADSNSMQGVQPLLRRYCTWRAISWSDRGGRKEKVSKNLEGKRDEAVGVSDAFGDRSRRGSRSPERRDRGREKATIGLRPSGVPRLGSARKPGEHRARGSRRAVVSDILAAVCRR
jgi:hypothetical protein